MKMQASLVTRALAIVFLAMLAAAGVGIASLFVPSPYHYAGVVLPFVVLYLLGLLASKFNKQ